MVGPFRGIGGGNTDWLGIPLPFDMSPFGATECSVLAAPTVFWPLVATTDASGYAELTLPIPQGGGIAGKTFYSQWMVLDASANPLGVVFSDGLAITLQP